MAGEPEAAASSGIGETTAARLTKSEPFMQARCYPVRHRSRPGQEQTDDLPNGYRQTTRSLMDTPDKSLLNKYSVQLSAWFNA